MINQGKARTRLALFILIISTLMLVLQSAAAAPDVPAAPIHAPDWSTSQLMSGAQSAEVPKIAAAPNSNTVMVAYNQLVSGGNNGSDPYYRVSTNNGSTWSAAAPIHTSPTLGNNSVDIAIAYDGTGMAHAIWVEDLSLVYAPKNKWPTNTGANPPTTISSVTISPGAATPMLVATGNTILDVIWSEGTQVGGNPNIHHARSLNSGASWPIKDVIQTTPGESRVPAIALSPTNSNILYAVWEEQISGNKSAVKFAQGTVSGTTVTWSAPITLSPDSTGTNISYEQPEILATSQSIQVTYSYHDVVQDSQAVYSNQCNNGSNCTQVGSWSSPTNISGQFISVNGTLPFYVISTIVRYGGCTQIYYHGVELGLLQDNELIWGVNSCDSWSSGGIDRVTDPVEIRAVNPDLIVGSGGWIYMTYTEVVADNMLQVYFTSSQDDNTLPHVFLPVIFRK